MLVKQLSNDDWQRRAKYNLLKRISVFFTWNTTELVKMTEININWNWTSLERWYGHTPTVSIRIRLMSKFSYGSKEIISSRILRRIWAWIYRWNFAHSISSIVRYNLPLFCVSLPYSSASYLILRIAQCNGRHFRETEQFAI